MTVIVLVGGMPWPKIGATDYYSQLGLLDKGHEIKGFVGCNSWEVSGIGPAKWPYKVWIVGPLMR